MAHPRGLAPCDPLCGPRTSPPPPRGRRSQRQSPTTDVTRTETRTLDRFASRAYHAVSGSLPPCERRGTRTLFAKARASGVRFSMPCASRQCKRCLTRGRSMTHDSTKFNLSPSDELDEFDPLADGADDEDADAADGLAAAPGSAEGALAHASDNGRPAPRGRATGRGAHRRPARVHGAAAQGAALHLGALLRAAPRRAGERARRRAAAEQLLGVQRRQPLRFAGEGGGARARHRRRPARRRRRIGAPRGGGRRRGIPRSRRPRRGGAGSPPMPDAPQSRPTSPSNACATCSITMPPTCPSTSASSRCARPRGGAKTPDINAAVDNDLLVQKPRFYAPHFVDKLEKCDALAWQESLGW